MKGIDNLKKILVTLEPVLQEGEYVFCTFEDESLEDTLYLDPIAIFREKEGLTLIIEKEIAQKYSIVFVSVFRLISLSVHSSLEAVGLTAAFAQKLASKGISANVMAAYFHDHIFVQSDKALLALEALKELQRENIG